MRIPTPMTRKPFLVGASVTATAVIAGLVTWAVWPEEQHSRKPREREYKATTACLLTDDKGITGDTAKAAWTGMQEASLATHIKVQYLAITGPQHAANGLSYYNTLGMRKCTVIIAAGGVPVAAMNLGAGQFHDVQQIAIGTPAPEATVPGKIISGPANPGATLGDPAPAGPLAGIAKPNRAGDATAPAGRTTVVTIDSNAPDTIQRRIRDIVARAADR